MHDLERGSTLESNGLLKEQKPAGAVVEVQGAAPAQQALGTAAPFPQCVSWRREPVERWESRFLCCLLIFSNLPPCLAAMCPSRGAALVLTVPSALPADTAGAAGSPGAEPGRAEPLAEPG